MSKPRLITALSLALFLHWLATGHVTATVAGTTVTVPALALATAIAVAAAAAVITVTVWRLRVIRLAVTRPADGDDPEGGRS